MAEPRSIPIYTLSGGVSRQPASKRTPYQAENLDNCMVTLERSVEKRPGFSILPGVGEYDLSFLPLTADPYFVWYQLDRANRFLIIVDRSANSPTAKLIYVLKVSETGWENQTPTSQWDPDDPELVWNGVDVIGPLDPRLPIFEISALSTTGTALSRYNEVLARGTIKRDSRNYVTFGIGRSREIIRSLQFGTNILFMNTKVFAGFTSGTNGNTVGLDGLSTATVDDIGGKVTYFSSVQVIKTTDGRMYPTTYTFREGESADPGWAAQFVPVEDYVFGDFEKPWLGQSVRNFGELRFPPDNNDFIANNSNSTTTDETARDMLKLYHDPDTPHGDFVDGRGKVYYCDAPYLSLDAGFYRIVSFGEGQVVDTETGVGKPYTQKVRTPDFCSIIDKKRMPQRLVFSNNTWTLQPIEWSPRTVGDRDTNPGPSPFLTETKEARHVQLTAMANFRDRLFIAAGDVVFSSQLGVLEDMWIKDPSNVTVSDPVDVRAASNSYAEITAMIPFNLYLFINTKGGVQFELKGDNNLISPLTAEISSTTFYSTADLIDPLMLGSQIYFLDRGRLYIYLNQDSREFNTAVELSNTVRDYLPQNYQDATVAVAQNYILAVDEDNKNIVYVYCNRFDGNQLIQSAFWRYILSDNDEMHGIQVWDNYLYAVTKRQTTGGSGWYLMTNLLEQEPTDIPKMDSKTLFEITFDSVTAVNIETTLTVPYILNDDDVYVVLGPDFEEPGSAFKARSVSVSGNQTQIVISGIDLTEHIGRSVYVGNAFSMVIELSQVHLRGQDNNIVEGNYNMKTMQVRHANSGYYRVEATRRGRSNKLISEFSATNLENTNEIQKDGVFVAKIFGFADSTNVKIINDKLSPCNITQIDIRGIFNRNNTSLR